MVDHVARAKWDRVASSFNPLFFRGTEKRWAPWKSELFAQMNGRILFVALGTGLDVASFPPGKEITAIDISPKMVELAADSLAAYQGSIQTMVMDVHELTFADGEFDQVFTSCTFCSVPDPVAGLKSLRRVLKPGGELYMFEHTGSRYFPFKTLLNIMTPLSSRIGPEMNRNTVANVAAAGYRLVEVKNIFLDVVKTIKAVNDQVQ